MSNLETAPSPHTLRRVAIEPVTRVEGHGKVTILLDEENRIHQVRLHIVEFRGFEVFIRAANLDNRNIRAFPALRAGAHALADTTYLISPQAVNRTCDE